MPALETALIYFGSFLALGLRKLAVAFGQWHAAGQDAGAVVGIACLLAQLSYALLKPDAGAMGRLKLRLQLIFDVSIGEGVGDPRRLLPV